MKKKFTILIAAALMLLTMMARPVTAWGQTKSEVTDVLNRELTGVTGSSYSSWSGKTSNSDAVWAGQSAGGNESIQLRSNNNNSGIITTTSGGTVTKVTVTWNSNTSNGRTLNVYGKNAAYSAPSDLYGSDAGTLIGTIVCGTSTELTITDSYTHIGMRSASGAMYLTEIDVTWETGGGSGGSDPTITLSDTGTGNIGNYAVNTEITREFTVTQSNLTAPISLSATNGGTFTINNEPTNSIPAGDGSTVVTWHFTPTAVGQFTSEITASSGETSATCTYLGYAYANHNVIIDEMEHGTVTADPTSTYYYQNVTLTVTPDDGYELGTLSVLDGNNAPVTVTNNSFKMPDSDATVSATFVESSGSTVTDELTNSNTIGETTNNYSEWTATGISGAEYAGQSAGGNGTIQLRSNNSNSGIVSTTSGGKVKKVTVTWNSNTADARTLNIYGSNTAYTAASDLYGNNAGTLLGTLNKGNEETNLNITDDYAYIGIRSASGALYLDKIEIDWETSGTPTCVAPTFTPAAGTYYETQNVTITSATEGSTIYYTLDGNDPTISSNVYSEALSISETTTVKAMAVKEGYNNSSVSTAAYTITLPPVATPTFTPASGTYTETQNVTIACTTEGATIYYTIDGTDPTTESSVYSSAISISQTTTVKAMAVKSGMTNSEIATAVYSIEEALNTMQAIFDRATAVGNTATDVNIAFQNWVVSGVSTNGKNVFVTDGTKGFVIFNNGGNMGFAVGNILSGTVSCKVQLYNGFAEITQLNASTTGISIATGGTVTAANIAMADLSGVNTSALVHYDNLTCSVNNSKYYLTDGTTTLQVFNSLYAFGSLVEGKIYNITGVYQQYNTNSGDTKEILPRSADDIEEVVSTEPSITVADATVNVGAEGEEGTLTVTYENITEVVAEVWFCDAAGENAASYDWITANINEGNNVGYLVEPNEGEERTAYFKVWAYDDEMSEVYSNLVTVTQAAYVAPTPSIAVDPTLVEAPATGADGTITVTLTAIANDVIEVQWFESDGTTAATYNHDWIEAIVDPNNDINYVIEENTGDARSAYFKVYGLDGEANEIYSELVTINQAAGTTPPTPGNWEWVLTDLANLTANDVFVIVGYNGDTYAMANNNGTSSAPKVVKVTVANGALSGNIGDTIQWNLSISDDGYTFYPNGTTETWLYCTNTNNGVKVGTGDAKHFTLSDNGYITTSETTDQRYIGIYNSQDWRCYTSEGGNIADQTFAFYKRVPASTEPSITVTPATVNVTAEGEDDGILAIEYENLTITDPADFDIQYYNANNEPLDKDHQPEWMQASVQANSNQDGYEVSYSVDSNDGDARTAYFKVYALDGNFELVYSNLITVSQDAYVAPVATIAVTPETVNITSAGQNDGSLTIAYENLTITDPADFDIQYFDANNQPLEKDDEPDWMEASIIANSTQDGYVVSFSVDPNDGEARTAYFKVFSMGNQDFVYSNLVTINQAAYVVDYATLPFEWAGGSRSEFEDLNGTSTSGVGDYNNEATHKMKLDGTGDYIQIKTNEQPGIVTIGVKMVGGASTSYITVQGSADGETFTDVNTLTISGKQNDVLNLETTYDFAATDRYVRLYFTKGSNVGVGPITIAQVDLTPSITVAPATLNLNSDGGDGELTVTHKNLADDPQLEVVFYEADGETETTYNWITASINATTGNVDGHINANTGEARSAYLKVTGRDAENNLIKSNLVTFNQAAYTEPSIVFNTTSLDIVAGGDNRTLSFDYEGLGQNPTFSINFYESDGTTPATYSWIEAEITQDDKVNISVAANEGEARSAYFKVSGVNGEVNALSNLVTINQDAYSQLATYSLVTSIDDLTPGYHYYIAGKNGDNWFAMGGQNNNNRSAVAVDVTNNMISETANVCEFVISGDATSLYTIYDELETEKTPGYLYAPSGNSNYLRTQATNTDNGVWTISLDDETHVATIKANISTDKYMRYNSGSTIFSCYNSNTNQKDVYLYKKNNDNNIAYYSSTAITLENPTPSTNPIIILDNEILTITGNVSCSPDDILIQDGGQLIHDNPINATIQRNVKGYNVTRGTDNSGYLLIASPVIEPVNVNSTNLDDGDFDLYIFDQNQTSKEWRNYKAGEFSTIENTKGYLYANTSNITISFGGELKPSDTNVPVTLALTDGNRFAGFNLIGNPFACNAYLVDNENKAVASYRMNDNGDDFTEKVSLSIAPMEGVLVEATANQQVVYFSRTAPTPDAGKGNLNIQVAQVVNTRGAQPTSDNAIIRFDGGNTLEKFSFRDDRAKLYIPQGKRDYAVVNAEAQGETPLYFKAVENGTYTIDFSKENVEFSYLHLIDNLTGVDIDLLQNPSYSFEANNKDYPSRFRLLFKANGINANANENENFAFISNGNLMILGIDGEATLQVIDITGRILSSETFNGSYNKAVNEVAGVYMIRLIQGENVRTQKIVVK